LKQSAIVLGDIATQRISIEEGAYFKGGVDIQREAQKVPARAEVPQPRAEAKPESKPAATAGSAVASSPSSQGSVSSANREPGKL
jgi:cytoskeletal protein CcmA (bactofilin family)